MSRFLSPRHAALTPYTPGEQPRDMQYVKLNTNESPFPPSGEALRKARENARSFERYSDPECLSLRRKLSGVCGVSPDEVMMTNGSDEALNLAFMAFCDDESPALFPDVTYGFYEVYARVNRLPYEIVPLREDFSLCLDDYRGKKGTLFLANPNAPTGMALPRAQIRDFVLSRPDQITVVDEAYVDFGAESCIPLIRECPNLLVVQTFSKSRSLAGARLGFAAGQEALIRDLNTLRYATAPYNVNSFTQALGEAVLDDEARTKENCRVIGENRAWTEKRLKEMGFTVLPSCTNFVFAKTDRMAGAALYRALRDRGILVRHFDTERIKDYNRITVGAAEQMQALIKALREILG